MSTKLKAITEYQMPHICPWCNWQCSCSNHPCSCCAEKDQLTIKPKEETK